MKNKTFLLLYNNSFLLTFLLKSFWNNTANKSKKASDINVQMKVYKTAQKTVKMKITCFAHLGGGVLFSAWAIKTSVIEVLKLKHFKIDNLEFKPLQWIYKSTYINLGCVLVYIILHYCLHIALFTALKLPCLKRPLISHMYSG